MENLKDNLNLEIPKLRKEDILTMCATCKKIKVNDNWVDEKEYPEYKKKVDYFENREDKGISHGICPSCYKQVIKEYSQSKKE